MRNLSLLAASALVLALGVASASAQPSNQQYLTRGDTGAFATYSSTSSMSEGRAAMEAPAANGFMVQPHAGR